MKKTVYIKILSMILGLVLLGGGFLQAEENENSGPIHLSVLTGNETYSGYSSAILYGIAMGTGLNSVFPKTGAEIAYTISGDHHAHRSKDGNSYTLSLKTKIINAYGWYEIYSLGKIGIFSNSNIRVKGGVSYLTLVNTPEDYNSSKLTIKEKTTTSISASYGVDAYFQFMSRSSIMVQLQKNSMELFQLGIGYSHSF